MSKIHEYLMSKADYLAAAKKVASPGILPDALPDAFKDFFGQMILMHYIPFHYLVADERMLPLESIRFFSVDPNWMKALLDGAFSIGRAVESDQIQDTDTWPTVHQAAIDYALNMRNDLMGKTTTQKATSLNISGFILRSQVNVDYPNIEALAYTDVAGTQLAPTLRLDRLNDNMLIGLFEGNIQQVVFKQPTEGIHFGFDLNNKGDYIKNLRQLSGAGIGSLFNPNQSITNTSFRTGYRNTIPIARLAQQIHGQLKKVNKSTSSEFTSSEFALEMVQSAGEAVISNQ